MNQCTQKHRGEVLSELGTANLNSALIQGQQALATWFKQANIDFLCNNGCQLWKTKLLENFKFVSSKNIKKTQPTNQNPPKPPTKPLNYWYIANVKRILVEVKNQKKKHISWLIFSYYNL